GAHRRSRRHPRTAHRRRHGNSSDLRLRSRDAGARRSRRAMTTSKESVIRNVATGIPGLDAVLGGGLCEYSFNLVAGAPGAGKTTLVQQFLFANATAERPALYFTVLGEPTVKMLRYQRQYTFFDAARVPS